MAEKKANKKSFVGSVIADKTDKTVVVAVERLVKHPVYGKYLKRRVKYMAHDEKNECRQGDKVRIIETRPLSKLKRWIVSAVVEKAR